jgi:hypothetical protein
MTTAPVLSVTMWTAFLHMRILTFSVNFGQAQVTAQVTAHVSGSPVDDIYLQAQETRDLCCSRSVGQSRPDTAIVSGAGGSTGVAIVEVLAR